MTLNKLINKSFILRQSLNKTTLKGNYTTFFSNLEVNSKYLHIRTLLVTSDDKHLSLGKAQIIDFSPNGISKFINNMLEEFTPFLERYETIEFKEIKIFYGDSTLKDYLERKLISDRVLPKGKTHSLIKALKLPKKINYDCWGKYTKISAYSFGIKNIVFNKNIAFIQVDKGNDKNILRIEMVNGTIYYLADKFIGKKLIDRSLISVNKHELTLPEPIDSIDPDDLELLKVVNNTPTLTYDLSNITLKPQIERNIAITYSDKDKTGKPKDKATFATLDLETILGDVSKGVQSMKLVCASVAFESITKSYYLADFLHSYHKDVLEGKTIDCESAKTVLINRLFEDLFETRISLPPKNKLVIYIHNGSKFDLVFLVNELLNFDKYNLECLYKDGNFLSLTIKDKKTNVSIQIKDSLLILQSSLDKLAKSFNVPLSKTIFPYTFTNINNLYYEGPVPESIYFDNKKVTLDQYNEYKASFNGYWNLRQEVTKYCENDCRVLYLVIDKFSKLILSSYSVNIHNYPTLSSIAYRIFKTLFLKEKFKMQVGNRKKLVPMSDIPVVAEHNYEIVKQAFFGGHCDMYIPTNPVGTNIYCYDVNSLYPFVMQQFEFPTKFIGKFEGDVRVKDPQLWNDTLGFYHVKVYCPKSIIHPILPVKVNGITVFPTGEWTGLYFSEEIKNAEKFGYKFDILGGIAFTKSDLFSKYINKLYHVKCSTPRDDPMYGISKLLLNSLYGRFGLNPSLPDTIFVKADQIVKLAKLNIEIDFGNYKLASSFGMLPLSIAGESNVGIAAAVTAYARIHMSQFKNNPNFNLYYSDTDSIYIDKELDNSFISETVLGKLKLEKVLSKFVGVGPKFYGGVDAFNGKEFSKVKGFSSSLTINQLESLLIKGNSLSLDQSKWYRDYKNSNVFIKNTTYYSKLTGNKRISVFDHNNLLVNTKPYNFIG